MYLLREIVYIDRFKKSGSWYAWGITSFKGWNEEIEIVKKEKTEP